MFMLERESAPPCGERTTDHAGTDVIMPVGWSGDELEDDPILSFEPDEFLAAYLAREMHVAPLLRLLLGMTQEQRHTVLAMAQCLALTQPCSVSISR